MREKKGRKKKTKYEKKLPERGEPHYVCMGLLGDFKKKLVNGVGDGDGDDGIATREASTEYTKHARRAVTQ